MGFKGNSSGRLFGGSGGFMGTSRGTGMSRSGSEASRARYELGPEFSPSAPSAESGTSDRSNRGKLPARARQRKG